MKRKYVYFLIVIWIIGTVVIITHMIQLDIESKISQWLSIYNCSAENINYSLFNKKVEINNIHINSENGNSVVGNIDYVNIYDINRDSFNGDYGDLVKLSRKIEINGINIKKNYDNRMINVSIDKLYGENLYMNLATSARMMLETKDLSIFSTFIDRYHVGNLLFENTEVRISSLSQGNASSRENSVISEIDTFMFPNGLGCMLKQEKDESFSVKGEGAHIVVGEDESVYAKKFEIANIITDRKNCSAYADLFKFEDKYKIINIDMVLDILKNCGIPFEFMNLENVSYSSSQLINDINIKNLIWNFEKGATLEASLSLEEFQILFDENLLQELAISDVVEKELVQNPLTLDLSSNISISQKNSDMENNNLFIVNANIHKLAEIKILLELNTSELDNISNVLYLYNTLEKMKITSLNIEYEDAGLIPLIFNSISNTENKNIQDIKDEITAYAQSIQKRKGILGLVKSVNIMMEHPGVLNFTYIPEIEMPLFFNIGDFESGEIMLKAHPGKNKLEELL